MKKSSAFDRIVKILGASVLTIFLITTLDIVTLPTAVQFTGLFLLSPIVILVILTLHEKYQPQVGFVSLQRFAVVFFIIAFSIANIMIVVQQAGRYYYSQIADQVENVKPIYLLFNSIQLGMDVSFDIFYSIGIFLFSLSFLARKGLALGLGLFGIVISTGLLAFNIFTFPSPPKDAGLVDLGPYTIVWWLLLVLILRRQSRNV